MHCGLPKGRPGILSNQHAAMQPLGSPMQVTCQTKQLLRNTHVMRPLFSLPACLLHALPPVLESLLTHQVWRGACGAAHGRPDRHRV